MDRNVSPRLGFLSYNSMMLKRRKSKKRIDSSEWLYLTKAEAFDVGENNKMMTRTKYTLEAVLPPAELVQAVGEIRPLRL